MAGRDKPPAARKNPAAGRKNPTAGPGRAPAARKAARGAIPGIPAERARVPRSLAARRERAAKIYEILLAQHPTAHCELDHRNPYELTAATILSAQCTDRRVNMVTPELFNAYPDAAALSAARIEDVEEIIRSTGFFRSKAKSLIGMATAVTERHNGEIPSTMDELVKLPGVGRKTANVVLGNAFGINEGIVVDTHVSRVSQRLGLTKERDPVKIEQDLVKLFPRECWTMLSHLMIFHGRRICDARRPRCEVCPLVELCPSAFRV